ncbi:MAG: sulfotransferase family 2 domain-containing protein [Myxococcota bacterium]
MSATEPRNLLVQIHVPKTGGMTLQGTLHRVYGDARFYFVQNPQAMSDELERFATRLAATPSLRMVSGHIAHGIAEAYGASGRYFTALRDPVDRVLSHYRHHKRKGWNLTLREFLETQGWGSWNVQARMLSGFELDDQRKGLWTGLPGTMQPADAYAERWSEDLTQRALDNLDACAVVGLTHRFDEYVTLLATTLGWPLRHRWYVTTNVAPTRRTERLDGSDLRAIWARTEHDHVLWRVARDRFAQDWAAAGRAGTASRALTRAASRVAGSTRRRKR